MDVWIKNSDGSVFIGLVLFSLFLSASVCLSARATDTGAKVWPGTTAFPDWFHPNATTYWMNQITNFLSGVPIDGSSLVFCLKQCCTIPPIALADMHKYTPLQMTVQRVTFVASNRRRIVD
jgi:alpha-glucosidase